MPIQVQYLRGYAGRVFDALGSMGFHVVEDGRLCYCTPPEGASEDDKTSRMLPHTLRFYADPGDWLIKDDNGVITKSREPIQS